jgi:hypothetical protein
MIDITNPNGERKVFRDYHQVCDYIKAIELRKIVSEPDAKTWGFIRRPYEMLCYLYYRTPSLKSSLTLKEREAVEKKLGLVEIKKGNREHFTQILFTSNLDLEPLKRDWCKEYCLENGFEINELVLKN